VIKIMGAPNELSFLPDDYLERKQRRRTNAICAILFCVVIGAIGGAFTVTERSMREIEKQYTDVEQQYTDAARRIEQVQQMQDKQRTMAHQAELTASLLEKVPRSFILAEITNGIPSGVSLLDFSMASVTSTKAAAPTAKTAFEVRQAEINAANGNNTISALATAQAKVYDVNMKITGVAPNDGQVAQFIAKLDRSTMFQDVNLVFTDEFKESERDVKLRKFQIEMTLNPAAKIEAGTTPVRDTGTAAVQMESGK
jgi:Tfp pilus assembly protein PilN